jgi:hypothetical protein
MPPKPITLTCQQCQTVFGIDSKRFKRTRKYCSLACYRLSRGTPSERFWRRVDKNGPTPWHRPDLGPCWLWTGYLSRGYGQLSVMGERGQVPEKAHRLSWGFSNGPIPDALTLDHICHNGDTLCPSDETCQHRRCVNPKHLELATIGDNTLRGNGLSAMNARKTRCNRDHDDWKIDRHGDRVCMSCRRENEQRPRRAAGIPKRFTVCQNGHPRTEGSTRVDYKGLNLCRECESNKNKRRAERLRARGRDGG